MVYSVFWGLSQCFWKEMLLVKFFQCVSATKKSIHIVLGRDNLGELIL